MKISHLVFFSISFILLLFSITTYTNYRQSEQVRENAAFFTLTSDFIKQTNQFQRNILDMERSLRGFLLTSEDYLLQTYDSTKTENEGIYKDLTRMAADNPEQRSQLGKIREYYDQWINTFADPMRAKRSRADRMDISDSTFEKIYLNHNVNAEEELININLRRAFAALRDAEYKNRAYRKEVLATSETKTKIISFALTSLSIFVGFLIAFLLARHISGRIKTMVALSNNIAAGNYDARVAKRGHDELAYLADSLNAMAITLSRNIDLLRTKNKELDDYAHIVSHDLKAPLRGIDNVVNWIREDHGESLHPKVAEYLELIKGRTQRLENLISGILSYARIGKKPGTTDTIDVRELVEEIVEDLPEKKGYAFEISDKLPSIHSDRLLLSLVLTNLVSNAVKYNDKEKGVVKIYSKQIARGHEFTVEDNGPGIAAAYHQKIYNVFETLQERDSFESTGIGLAIVKKILTSRNDTISLLSEPGKGAKFIFTWTDK